MFTRKWPLWSLVNLDYPAVIILNLAVSKKSEIEIEVESESESESESKSNSDDNPREDVNIYIMNFRCNFLIDLLKQGLTVYSINPILSSRDS